MQGVQSTREISPRTKTRIAGSKSASSPQTLEENVVVEKAKLASKLCNPGPHQCTYVESIVHKLVMSEHIEGITDLMSMPTPINLFEDECAFCHSFRTTMIHGPMARYLMGRIVSGEEGNQPNGIYVHRKCLEWAPRVWFDGDIVKNLESEIRRASRLRCSRCGLTGAALGCFYERCDKSFHVPCAVQIYGCRWDVDCRLVLCPEHVAKVLPCDKMSSQTKERHKFSSLPQSQCSQKEKSVAPFQGEGQQIDQQNTGKSFPLSFELSRDSSQYLESVENFEGYQAESQQTNQLNTLNSSTLPQSCCSDEEGMFYACQDEEIKTELQETSSYPSNKLVLLGLSLSASEKDSLEDFACWTNATVMMKWDENVTHVIVGKNVGSAWRRSYEVLMAILFGKWVVQTEWILDCLELCPDREDSYEVTFSDDSDRPLDGPKKGRTRAAEGAPKLFSGLHFCLSECMNPGDSDHLRKLIAAAGGRVLEPSSSLHWRWLRQGPSPRPYFVYDGGAPGRFSASSLRMEEEEARRHAAAGAWVISHLRVLDAVAAYDPEVLDHGRKGCV